MPSVRSKCELLRRVQSACGTFMYKSSLGTALVPAIYPHLVGKHLISPLHFSYTEYRRLEAYLVRPHLLLLRVLRYSYHTVLGAGSDRSCQQGRVVRELPLFEIALARNWNLLRGVFGTPLSKTCVRLDLSAQPSLSTIKDFSGSLFI